MLLCGSRIVTQVPGNISEIEEGKRGPCLVPQVAPQPQALLIERQGGRVFALAGHHVPEVVERGGYTLLVVKLSEQPQTLGVQGACFSVLAQVVRHHSEVRERCCSSTRIPQSPKER